MKRVMLSVTALFVFTALLLAQNQSLSFTQVVDKLDLSKKTSLAAKNFWTKVVGTEVTWSGKVDNVKGGRGKAQILVGNDARRLYKGYNIVLTTFDVDRAATLEIGQKIRFSGYLNKYKSRKGRAVIIYLTDVQILK
jgi:hypothetical protein